MFERKIAPNRILLCVNKRGEARRGKRIMNKVEIKHYVMQSAQLIHTIHAHIGMCVDMNLLGVG